MAQPKLFSLYQAFTEHHWNYLKQNLKPLILGSADQSKLFLAIMQFRHRKKWDQWEHFIWKKQFHKFNKKRFLSLCSQLFVATENIIAQYELTKDNAQRDLALIRFYNKHNLFKLADKRAELLQFKIDQNTQYAPHIIMSQFELLHRQYYSDNPIKMTKGTPILEGLVHAYLKHTAVNLLFYQCELYNWGGLRKVDFTDLNETINKICSLIPESPESILLSKLQAVIKKNDTDAFEELCQILYQRKIDPKSELFIVLCIYLNNFAIRFWQTGIFTNLDKIIALTEFSIENNIFLVNNFIPVNRFLTFVSIFSPEKSEEWIDNFLDKWVSLVGEENKETVRNVSKSLFLISNNRENEILPLLRTIKLNTGNMILRVRALTIISLYSTRKQDLVLLKREIHNFKIVLRNQKRFTTPVYHLGIKNFVKVIELLLKKPMDKQSIDLTQFKVLSYKTWLRKQM